MISQIVKRNSLAMGTTKKPIEIIPSIVFLISLLVSQCQGFDPTRNVSVDATRFESGSIKLYLVCPNVRSKTDIVTYYKVKMNENVLLRGKEKAFGIVVTLNSVSDLGLYRCSIFSEDNTTRSANINVMDDSLGPSKYIGILYNHL